jgi:hypothetical protein
MGRSRNTALILVSQNAGDLLSEQVTNCISGVFAFRSSERVEVANVMALLGVEASDEHKAVLRGLGNGECIFRDLDGRAGRIGIDLISDELRQWLDTNPTRARRSGESAPPDGRAAPPDGHPAPGGDPVSATGKHSASQHSASQHSASQHGASQHGASPPGTGPPGTEPPAIESPASDPPVSEPVN